MPIHRTFKNVMHNYTSAEVKVREATSNDPWGPTAQIINEISELSYSSELLGEMMGIIWKRLMDGGRNWRHVYKSLVLLDHMAKVGSEKVVQQCRANLGALEVLSSFEYVGDDGKDDGVLIREKSKQLVALLRDEQRFTHERSQAIQARDRLKKNAGLSMGSGQSNMKMPHSKSADRYLFSKLALSGGSHSPVLSEELEAVRPSSHGEEDLQLELALAISKQEHDAQLQQKKGDQLKLQMALEESKKSVETSSSLFGELSLQGNACSSWASNAQPVVDAWGVAVVSTTASETWTGVQIPTKTVDSWGKAPVSASATKITDTWSGTQVQQADPWGKVQASEGTATKADPWGEDLPTDPWSSTLPRGNVICVEPLVADVHNISDFVDDEFDLLSSRLKPQYTAPLAAPVYPGDLIGGLDPDVDEKRKKSAEDFLGENSTLVNLKQLLPQPPLQSVVNPFALTIGSKTLTQPNNFNEQNFNKRLHNKIKQTENKSTEIADIDRSANVNYPQHLITKQNAMFQIQSDIHNPVHMQAMLTFPQPSINQSVTWPGSLQPLSVSNQQPLPYHPTYTQSVTYPPNVYHPINTYLPNNAYPTPIRAYPFNGAYPPNNAYPSNNNPFL